MLLRYQPSEIEEIVSDLYQNFGIESPCQMDIDFIASIWGVEVWHYPFPAQSIWNDDHSIICLNTMTAIEKRRADFFHELGHIVRHEGHQEGLHPLFVELQEWQANRFQLIAAMPYYLLPDPVHTWNEYAGVLADTFRVPVTMALRRVATIKARLQPEENKKGDFDHEGQDISTR